MTEGLQPTLEPIDQLIEGAMPVLPEAGDVVIPEQTLIPTLGQAVEIARLNEEGLTLKAGEVRLVPPALTRYDGSVIIDYKGNIAR